MDCGKLDSDGGPWPDRVGRGTRLPAQKTCFEAYTTGAMIVWKKRPPEGSGKVYRRLPVREGSAIRSGRHQGGVMVCPRPTYRVGGDLVNAVEEALDASSVRQYNEL